MFRRLIGNIAVTGVAYAAISGVGVVLAPFLMGLYGLAGYGQILLARIFLPNAFFGLLDLGIGETATRGVAQGRATGDWRTAAQTLTLLGVLAILLGIGVGAILVLISGQLPVWLSVAPAQADGFRKVVLLTAALMPLLFLSLVAEGALKGLEAFRLLRTCEVVAALTHGGLALTIGLAGYGPNMIAVGLLIALSIRFSIAGGAAIVMLRGEDVRPQRWNAATRRDVLHWSGLMLQGKFLGTLQNQVASPIIGFLLGPAAVGAYDLTVRLPRFTKTAFSLISTTVLPVATTLRATDDGQGILRLSYYGILGAWLLTAPAALFALIFSEAILTAWIGDSVSGYWPWQSAMFVVAMLNVPISFGGAILLAEKAGTQDLIRITRWQVVAQMTLALALYPLLAQWAFVMGQVVSVVIAFPLQYRVLVRRLGFDVRLVRRMAGIALVAIVTGIALMVLHRPETILTLAVAALGFGAIFALVAPWFVLGRDERAALLAAKRTWRTGRPATSG